MTWCGMRIVIRLVVKIYRYWFYYHRSFVGKGRKAESVVNALVGGTLVYNPVIMAGVNGNSVPR